MPLCKAQDCTLREADIVASVLQRVSIPVHHLAVAIRKMATQDSSSTHHSGATSVFLMTLLNKKYSLSAQVIASLVQYFVGFVEKKMDLPSLWLQSLLVLVQQYKHELQKSSVKEGLRRVLKRQIQFKDHTQNSPRMVWSHSLPRRTTTSRWFFASGSNSRVQGTFCDGHLRNEETKKPQPAMLNGYEHRMLLQLFN